MAVDADTRFLDKLGAGNLEVRRADVEHEDLPEAGVRSRPQRFLLQHLPERELVLEKLARAVKPGGLLVVFDSGGVPPVALQDRERFDRFAMAFLTAAASPAGTSTWAPSLPQRLAELGLDGTSGRARSAST